MWVVCKICGKGCQWCGRKCWCWWGAYLISTVNSLYDLWMSVDIIKANKDEIYRFKNVYSPVEMYDHYVNGKERPEWKAKKVVHIPQKTYENTVKNFVEKENPNSTCVYDSHNVSPRDRCIYCNSVRMYAPKICKAYKGGN